ncbi:MAG: glycogen/starch synthase [Polyangiaceae bacterium]|nr:glycogen/starch synthase [Polyangiaceae bacterium]
MEILLVTPELSPFTRGSDAGDTVAALAKHLRHLGHEITILLPRYPGLEAQGLLLARRLSPLVLPSGVEVSVLDGRLPSGVKLVALDAPLLFDRAGVYGEELSLYPDNAQRFGLLAQAAVALVRQHQDHGARFDIVQLNDWPGALVPLLLQGESDVSVPTVLTVHDVRQQGSFPLSELRSLGATEENAESLMLGGQLNVLKSGLLLASAVTTVSDAYAEGFVEPDQSGELATFIAQSKGVLGINNGVDYALFNPAADPLIVSRFDAEDPTNKQRNKSAVLLERGLTLQPGRPLVAVWADPREAESLKLLSDALLLVLKHDLSLIIASPLLLDDPRLVEMATRFPEVCALHSNADEAARHRLLAGADIYLSTDTSRLASMLPVVAQRYGAVPVALATPRTVDQVVDTDVDLLTGTGFLYDEASPTALVGALERALGAFASPKWATLRRRVMRLDISWDRPVRRYLQVFRQALAPRA